MVLNIESGRMENFVSSWSDGKKLPESYIYPPDKRPGNLIATTAKNIPVIDISKVEGLDRAVIVQQIMQASQEFGFFQVINHGVPYTLVNDTRVIFEEFFSLPAKEKIDLCSSDISKSCILLTSGVDYDRETYHSWKDLVRLNCTPLEEHKQGWSTKPAKFRDVVGDYTVEANILGSKILELISEGLGLECNYFAKEMSGDQHLISHYYPPCPDPSLTLGTKRHKDPSLITILLQGNVSGLQVLKDGEWIGVEAVPDAFVVNIGSVLQLVSNGKLQSVEHRAVTSKHQSRISVAFFITPEKDCVVEPAKAIVDAGNSPIYKSVRFADFFKMFQAIHNVGVDSVLGSYKI